MFSIKYFILLICVFFLCINTKAQNADSIFTKGIVEFEIGNYEKALAYFNEATLFHKNEKSLNYMAGMSEYNLKHYNQAKKYFAREIKISPRNTNAFLYKAKSKENLNKNNSALRDIKKALKIDSVNVLTLLEKSNILFNQKKYKKAIQSYLKVKTLSPKTEIVFYKLGFCEFYLNRTQQACNYWSNIEDLDDFENYETIIKTCNLKN